MSNHLISNGKRHHAQLTGNRTLTYFKQRTSDLYPVKQRRCASVSSRFLYLLRGQSMSLLAFFQLLHRIFYQLSSFPSKLKFFRFASTSCFWYSAQCSHHPLAFGSSLQLFLHFAQVTIVVHKPADRTVSIVTPVWRIKTSKCSSFRNTPRIEQVERLRAISMIFLWSTSYQVLVETKRSKSCDKLNETTQNFNSPKRCLHFMTTGHQRKIKASRHLPL